MILLCREGAQAAVKAHNRARSIPLLRLLQLFAEPVQDGLPARNGKRLLGCMKSAITDGQVRAAGGRAEVRNVRAVRYTLLLEAPRGDLPAKTAAVRNAVIPYSADRPKDRAGAYRRARLAPLRALGARCKDTSRRTVLLSVQHEQRMAAVAQRPQHRAARAVVRADPPRRTPAANKVPVKDKRLRLRRLAIVTIPDGVAVRNQQNTILAAALAVDKPLQRLLPLCRKIAFGRARKRSKISVPSSKGQLNSSIRQFSIFSTSHIAIILQTHSIFKEYTP